MHYTNLRTHSLTHFAETVQPIVVPFGMWTLIGPENRELDGGSRPQGKGQFGERGHFRAHSKSAGNIRRDSLPRELSRSADSFRRDLITFLFSFYWRTSRIRGFAIMR